MPAGQPPGRGRSLEGGAPLSDPLQSHHSDAEAFVPDAARRAACRIAAVITGPYTPATEEARNGEADASDQFRLRLRFRGSGWRSGGDLRGDLPCPARAFCCALRARTVPALSHRRVAAVDRQ